MSKVYLSPASQIKLQGINPKIIKVLDLAFLSMPFDVTVLEGVRSIQRQRELVATGKSQTMKSYHLTGDAVDLAPWPVDWKDIGRFKVMAEHILQAATELSIPITWGGSWKTLIDMPHFQCEDRQ